MTEEKHIHNALKRALRKAGQPVELPSTLSECKTKLAEVQSKQLAHEKKTSWAKRSGGSAGGLIGAVAIALWLRGCAIGAFSIPSPSMVPTLLPGDFLFVNKMSYAVKVPYTDIEILSTGTPSRGDIVVFPSPCEDKTLIKRIVALPGDKVEMRCEKLYINEKPVKSVAIGWVDSCHDVQADRCQIYEQTMDGTTFYSTLIDGVGTRDGFPTPGQPEFSCGMGVGPDSFVARPDQDKISNRVTVTTKRPQTCEPFAYYTVPDDYVLMMGDNRRNSRDGQFWGPIEINKIVGKATFIFASKPYQDFILKFWKFRPSRMGKWIHGEPLLTVEEDGIFEK